MGRIGRERAFFHVELNQQETEFLMMSKVRFFTASELRDVMHLILKWPQDGVFNLAAEYAL